MTGLICFLFLRKNNISLPLICCMHCCLGSMQLMPDLKAWKPLVTGYNKLISFTNFTAQFLYSLTICMLHYNPRYVSSINMPIFRRRNCVITASGIVTLCTAVYRE